MPETRIYDDLSDRYFWFNVASGESRWEEPEPENEAQSTAGYYESEACSPLSTASTSPIPIDENNKWALQEEMLRELQRQQGQQDQTLVIQSSVSLELATPVASETSRNPAASEPASGNPVASELASGNPAASEWASGNPAASELASGNPVASESANPAGVSALELDALQTVELALALRGGVGGGAPVTVASSMAATVEPVWEQCVDPTSGHYYYYNRHTQESSWDRPAEASIIDGLESTAESLSAVSDFASTESVQPVAEIAAAAAAAAAAVAAPPPPVPVPEALASATTAAPAPSLGHEQGESEEGGGKGIVLSALRDQVELHGRRVIGLELQLVEYQQAHQRQEGGEGEQALAVEIDREVRVLKALRLQYQQMCAAQNDTAAESEDSDDEGDDDKGESEDLDGDSSDGGGIHSLWKNALWMVAEGVKSHAELIDLVISAPAKLIGMGSDSEDSEDGEDEEDDPLSVDEDDGDEYEEANVGTPQDKERVNIKVHDHGEEEEKAERRY
jgi:hypothetical protein